MSDRSDYDIEAAIRRSNQAYADREMWDRWLATLSPEDRATVVAAGVHRPELPTGQSGFIIRDPHAQEQAQKRIENIIATEEQKSPEDTFISLADEYAREVGEQISPSLSDALIRAFNASVAEAIADEIKDAEWRGYQRAGEVIQRSDEPSLKLRWDCLAIATKQSPLTLSEVAAKHTPPNASKNRTKQNASKVAKRMAAGLKAAPRGGTLKDAAYSKRCAQRATRVHAEKKADGKPITNTHTPCLKQSSLLRLALAA